MMNNSILSVTYVGKERATVRLCCEKYKFVCAASSDVIHPPPGQRWLSSLLYLSYSLYTSSPTFIINLSSPSFFFLPLYHILRVQILLHYNNIILHNDIIIINYYYSVASTFSQPCTGLIHDSLRWKSKALQPGK